ncbi:MAG TPA: ABC transporter permease [Polyangiaceae bacterium]|nr:ABC transporter permease [Polyangiaceae bacterium]
MSTDSPRHPSPHGVSDQSFRAHPLVELTKTRIREFLREKGLLFWVFGFPILMAIGLGLAFRERPAELPRIAVVDDAQRPAARALLSSPELNAERMTHEQARRAVSRAKVDVAVEWEGRAPSDASSTERPALHFDPLQDKSAYARAVVDSVLERHAGRKDLVEEVLRPVTERGARYIDFLVPGLIALNIMGSSMWGVGFNLVLARKRKLLRRYAVTPMRRSHFLLSYFFSRCVFLAMELTVLVAFGYFVFGSTVRGNLGVLALMAFSGAASFAAISLMIGARVENTEAASGWMNFVQLPMWILSGTFFSYERFPHWLQVPIRFMPLTALNDALRAVYSGEGNALGLLSHWLILMAWGAAGFLIAARTFRWQ